MPFPCCYLSLTGIDTTDINDPDKIWKCDACGTLYKIQENPYKLIEVGHITDEVFEK